LKFVFWEGEAPAEPAGDRKMRLSRSFALPTLRKFQQTLKHSIPEHPGFADLFNSAGFDADDD
jgi:hypothetical protein